jgi:hypothetical protein
MGAHVIDELALPLFQRHPKRVHGRLTDVDVGAVALGHHHL